MRSHLIDPRNAAAITAKGDAWLVDPGRGAIRLDRGARRLDDAGLYAKAAARLDAGGSRPAWPAALGWILFGLPLCLAWAVGLLRRARKLRSAPRGDGDTPAGQVALWEGVLSLGDRQLSLVGAAGTRVVRSKPFELRCRDRCLAIGGDRLPLAWRHRLEDLVDGTAAFVIGACHPSPQAQPYRGSPTWEMAEADLTFLGRGRFDEARRLVRLHLARAAVFGSLTYLALSAVSFWLLQGAPL
jgi:hypothetical protein